MRVLITQTIDDAGLKLLTDAGLEVDVRAGEAPIGRDELLQRVVGCAGLMPVPTDRIDGAVMNAGPLKVIAHHAVGYDNIDLDAARSRGVIVTNTPGVLTAATADLTLALILAVARRLPEGQAIMRRNAFAGWRPLMLRGLALDGARLGIVGLGRIGQAVARRAEAFGMEIVHHSRTARARYPRVELDELLATSDVVSLHCPLTPETRHLIDRAALGRMKRGALLINTSRGSVMDEEEVARALDAGHLGGVGLDVFENEPKVHPALAVHPRAVLVPHIGSATVAARRNMALKAARNLIIALRGETPPDRVA